MEGGKVALLTWDSVPAWPWQPHAGKRGERQRKLDPHCGCGAWKCKHKLYQALLSPFCKAAFCQLCCSPVILNLPQLCSLIPKNREELIMNLALVCSKTSAFDTFSPWLGKSIYPVLWLQAYMMLCHTVSHSGGSERDKQLFFKKSEKSALQFGGKIDKN